MEQIHIKVTENSIVKTGSKQMTFNKSGGYIGSGEDCQWIIQDMNDSIKEKHIHIKSNGETFCLMPYKGCQVYMNGDHSPIITSYYIIISIGDTFKIGDIEFTVVSERDLDDLSEDITDNSIEDIKEFNKLDHYTIVPEGQLDGFKVEEEMSIDDLVDNKSNSLGIEETTIDAVHDPIENNVVKNNIISKDVLKNFIIDECDNILNNEIKKQTNFLELMSKEKNRISTKDLTHILSNFNLINNTKVINLLVISILFKELNSPFFNEIEQDGFDKILSTLIKNASTDQSSIERLVLRAIKKYAGE